MNIKHKWVIPLLLLITIGLVGCSKEGKSSNTQLNQKSQVLSGVYRISDKDSDTDDNGNKQPGYYYFKKNGKVLWAQNETGDKDEGNYGGAARGTWKSLGDNMFKIHLKYVYDNDVFTFKAKKTGNKLHTYSNGHAKYEWSADNNYKQPDMTYSDFMEIFNNGKNSQREKVQENGYDDPDNVSSSSPHSDEANVNHKQIAVMLYQLCYPNDDISKEPEMAISSYNGRQLIGNGGSVSIVRYSINGDTVTYSKKSQGSYGDDQTISVKELAKKYYSTSDQKSLVDKVASSLSTDN